MATPSSSLCATLISSSRAGTTKSMWSRWKSCRLLTNLRRLPISSASVVLTFSGRFPDNFSPVSSVSAWNTSRGPANTQSSLILTASAYLALRSTPAMSSETRSPCTVRVSWVVLCKTIHRFHNRLYNHGEGPY